MTTISSGPWDEQEIREFLSAAVIPVRVASNGSSGPLVQSLWFVPDGTTLRCCTQQSSVLARRLGKDDRIGFEVAADAPPTVGFAEPGSHRYPPTTSSQHCVASSSATRAMTAPTSATG